MEVNHDTQIHKTQRSHLEEIYSPRTNSTGGKRPKEWNIQISEPQIPDRKVAFVPSVLQKVNWMMSYED